MKSSSNQHTKYIFVTGGVVSSLGKGIVAASMGALLEARGLKVTLTKADPYINVDPGTMNPFQHGEVFVTDDGAETDLDIGHYERFTSAKLKRENSFSAGQVYDTVLTNERKGKYLGTTVQVIPHITGEIRNKIFKASEGADISIVEIGGTVGDIESLPFLEAIRQIRYEFGRDNVLYVHLTLVPYIAASKELKTKPTQHSVRDLRQIGIEPDILVCRADREIPEDQKEKIGLFCNVERKSVISCLDMDSIYKVPMFLSKQRLDDIIVEKLNMWTRAPNLQAWENIVDCLDNPKETCRIGIVGKYIDVYDAYKSIDEALVHAGIATQSKVEIVHIDASKITKSNVDTVLQNLDGIIVPGGFGRRGIDGKIQAIHFARTKKVPFLGICLGMQLAAVEFARNVIGINTAETIEESSEELQSHNQGKVDSEQTNIIHLMESQKDIKKKGGTMRLGAYPCIIKSGTKVADAYKKTKISERHRHRYEFNNKFRSEFELNGAVLSGLSPDEELVEILEITEHPWFVGCQFHPELKSSPRQAHPLFKGIVGASLKAHKAKKAAYNDDQS